MDTTLYAEIIKIDKRDDGTLTVTGIATDPTVDSDEQICDPEWLKGAMPEWFKYGNVREMHDGIAAGVATDYQVSGEQHIITAHVVDPGSVAKVLAKVLKGFSVGIRNVRVVADKVARGGRIIGGEIVEVSLVDRPANPACVLQLAKAAGGTVLQVENLIEKGDSDMDDCAKCGKSAELNADGVCADCVAGAEESKVDDEAVDAAADEAGDDGADDDVESADEADDDKGDAPEGESADEEGAEEVTLASVAAGIAKILDLLSSKAEADKAMETRVGKVEKAVARPARTNTSKAARTSEDTSREDALKAERADLVTKSAETTDRVLAEGYRDRIAAIDRDLHK